MLHINRNSVEERGLEYANSRRLIEMLSLALDGTFPASDPFAPTASNERSNNVNSTH
jgi:hypothetical protein